MRRQRWGLVWLALLLLLASPALAGPERCTTEGGLEVDVHVEHGFACDSAISTRGATSP
jgi:hypothetical protein